MRIGQSVDVVGKAGNPKSIVGGHVQTTPVLLCAGEKAELASDQYESLSGVLEGFVILREKVSSQQRTSALLLSVTQFIFTLFRSRVWWLEESKFNVRYGGSTLNLASSIRNCCETHLQREKKKNLL